MLRDDQRRKARKLLRSPDLFFYDYFAKRLSRETQAGSSAADELGMPRDFITDRSELYDALVEQMVSKTCPIQEMPSAHPHERRLAVKANDFEYVVNVIREASLGRYEVVVRLASRRGGLSRVTFTDGQREYCNPTLVLDPWARRTDLVRSQNPNQFSSSVSVGDIHKTVLSPAPLYLAGKPERDLSMAHALGWRRSILNHFDHPVDVVYTWVDSADPAWRERKRAHLSAEEQRHEDNVAATRFRSRDELRYSLRSVRSFLPQARHIYIVTDQQRPAWLDPHDPNVTVVDHRDIFPDPSHLPSFNSHAIEANLHRIPGLSEHFLYFNDDILLLNPCTPLDFFHVNGIGKSFFEPLAHVTGDPSPEFPGFKNAALRGSRLLEERYGKSAHCYHEHTVHVLRRSVLEQMWRDFPEALETTSRATFRGDEDISPLSFFYHYYAIHNGYSVPAQIESAYVPLGRPGSGKLLTSLLSDRDTKVLCINDLPQTDAAAETALLAFLRGGYPAAAEWELDR